MASTDMYFTGKAKWCRVVNVDNYGAWSITLYPDNDSLERLRELQAKGLKNMMKKDQDGYYMKFKCEPSKVIRGKTITFERPSAVGSDNLPMDGLTIGNGSDVTIKLDVYEHGTPGGGKAVAARLKGVKVNNLVKFDTGDFTDGEASNVSGFSDQPEQLF